MSLTAYIQQLDAENQALRDENENLQWSFDQEDLEEADDNDEQVSEDITADADVDEGQELIEGEEKDERPKWSLCVWRWSCATHAGPGSLRVRSRLDDVAFYNSPAAYCIISAKLQHRMLHRALCIAQDIVWHALRNHYPAVLRRLYLYPPRLILFGRKELEQAVRLARWEFRQSPKSCTSIWNYMENVIDLRNEVSHFTMGSTEHVDQSLRRIQTYAVWHNDEPRAFKLRKMRDEIQREASRMYAMIQAGLAPRQERRKPWPLDIQRTLRAVYFTVNPQSEGGFGVLGNVPAPIVQAARQWRYTFRSEGEEDPDYVSAVKKSQKLMPGAGCKSTYTARSLAPVNEYGDVLDIEPAVGPRGRRHSVILGRSLVYFTQPEGRHRKSDAGPGITYKVACSDDWTAAELRQWQIGHFHEISRRMQLEIDIMTGVLPRPVPVPFVPPPVEMGDW